MEQKMKYPMLGYSNFNVTESNVGIVNGVEIIFFN
jgi:hypothetical protein